MLRVDLFELFADNAAMIFLEMSITRQAVANAFVIAILLAACCWLLHLTVLRARQLWRIRSLQLAFEETKDPQHLLRNTLLTLANTPDIRLSLKKPSLQSR